MVFAWVSAELEHSYLKFLSTGLYEKSNISIQRRMNENSAFNLTGYLKKKQL